MLRWGRKFSRQIALKVFLERLEDEGFEIRRIHDRSQTRRVFYDGRLLGYIDSTVCFTYSREDRGMRKVRRIIHIAQRLRKKAKLPISLSDGGKPVIEPLMDREIAPSRISAG